MTFCKDSKHRHVNMIGVPSWNLPLFSSKMARKARRSWENMLKLQRVRRHPSSSSNVVLGGCYSEASDSDGVACAIDRGQEGGDWRWLWARRGREKEEGGVWGGGGLWPWFTFFFFKNYTFNPKLSQIPLWPKLRVQIFNVAPRICILILNVLKISKWPQHFHFF